MILPKELGKIKNRTHNMSKQEKQEKVTIFINSMDCIKIYCPSKIF